MNKKFKVFASSLALAGILSTIGASNTFAAQSTNKAWSTESAQIRYDGHIQFKPSYVIPKSPGYGLKPGYTVNRAYINYTRDGKSVIGGRKYTARVLVGSSYVSTSATAWDTLNPVAPKTKFYYGWEYTAPY